MLPEKLRRHCIEPWKGRPARNTPGIAVAERILAGSAEHEIPITPKRCVESGMEIIGRRTRAHYPYVPGKNAVEGRLEAPDRHGEDVGEKPGHLT